MTGRWGIKKYRETGENFYFLTEAVYVYSLMLNIPGTGKENNKQQESLLTVL